MILLVKVVPLGGKGLIQYALKYITWYLWYSCIFIYVPVFKVVRAKERLDAELEALKNDKQAKESNNEKGS